MELLKSGELVGCPTVILSTIDGDDDQIDGLDSGAKDYLIKPVSMRVLEKHLHIRLAPRSQSLLVNGKLTIDTNKRTVDYDGRPIALTSTEFNFWCIYFAIRKASTPRAKYIPRFTATHS